VNWARWICHPDTNLFGFRFMLPKNQINSILG